MPAINMHPVKTDVGSTASFDGMVEPTGATGYKFSGTLKASCKLNRSATDFKNTIRIGHGGTSKSWVFLDFIIQGYSENTFDVEGQGERAPNETVDFSLNLNENYNGNFSEIAKAVVYPGGPPQKISPSYYAEDAFGNTTYDPSLKDGTARADGPSGFVIEGLLKGSAAASHLTQYATIGYKGASGSWAYTTVSFDEMPKQLKIVGSRKPGENIQVVIGATSRVANIYDYGAEISCALPEQF